MTTTLVETRRTFLEGQLEMITDGWAYCDSVNEERLVPQAYYDRLKAEYDALVASDAPTGERRMGKADPMALHKRREGGSAHRNQYGECQVRYASAKQTAYIKSLLERKELSGFDNSVFHLGEIVRQVQEGRINLRSASDLIDRLVSMPDKARSEGEPIGNPASDKQLAFITKLAGEKALADEDRAKVLAAVEGKTLSAKGASATIEKLLALPKATDTSAPTREDAGVWVDAQGNLFRVYFGQQSGRMLMMKAVDGELEYVGLARISDKRRATRDEVGAWGQTTGTCCVCGKALDDPTSVDRGIGPVCWAKF